MSLDEHVSTLIKRIYCAGENAFEWERVSRSVFEAVGAHAALTTLVDLTNRQYDSCRFYGPGDSRFARGIEEYPELCEDDPSLVWASRNPRARFCDSAVAVTTVDYLDNPYVQWNRARFGSTHWYVGYTPPEDQLSYSLSVHFAADQGPGEPERLRLFRMLFDHMDCAMRLSRRPFNPAAASAFVLLDGGGTVRELSEGARALIAAGDGLAISGGRLVPAAAADRAVLNQALARVASVVATGATPTAVRIARPSGQRPWLLTIKPLIHNYGPFGRVHCELLVHIHDGRPHLGSLAVMQALFGLTDRELEVLRRLTEGHSVETLANCLGISAHTARAHLRAIFAKTQTSRQSELLQLCMDLASG